MKYGESLHSLLILLSNVLDAHTTALFLHDKKHEQLQLLTSQSTSRFLLERISLPVDKSGLLAQVYKMGHPIHMGKVALDEVQNALPFYREGESGIKGLFVVPVAKGKALLYVDTKRSWGFTDKQQKWVMDIARIIQTMMEQEVCLLERDEYSSILSLWHHLGETALGADRAEEMGHRTVEQTARFLGADYGLLAQRDPEKVENYQLTATTSNLAPALRDGRFTTAEGLVGWVFRNGKPLWIQRMNPDAGDHFLFSPTENISHSGSFLGIHGRSATGHEFVLAFAAREDAYWSADLRHAVTMAFNFFVFTQEKLYWRDQCARLDTTDPVTGLLNGPGFEALVADHLASSLQDSLPFVLILAQFEPWQLLYTKISLAESRRWLQQISRQVREALPEDTFIGRLSESRFGLLFPGMAEGDVERCCAACPVFRQPFPEARKFGIKLRPYLGWAAYPQHGTRLGQLWAQAYRNLWRDFRRTRKGP